MKYRFSQRGAAAVEFALIAPLLFALLFGIIEMGAILYNQAVITNASREGARYAAGFYTNPTTATLGRPTCNNIQTYVTNYVNKYFIKFYDSDTFTTSNVKCCDNTTCSTGTNPYYNYTGTYAGYVDSIRVEFQYHFLALGGMIRLLTGGTWLPSWTLAARTSMRDENQQ
jgi:Flp pilus assembly protein TadG